MKTCHENGTHEMALSPMDRGHVLCFKETLLKYCKVFGAWQSESHTPHAPENDPIVLHMSPQTVLEQGRLLSLKALAFPDS